MFVTHKKKQEGGFWVGTVVICGAELGELFCQCVLCLFETSGLVFKGGRFVRTKKIVKK